jgi:WD40 repeat protein
LQLLSPCRHSTFDTHATAVLLSSGPGFMLSLLTYRSPMQAIPSSRILSCPHETPHFAIRAGSGAQVVAIGCENGSLQLLDTRSGAVKHTIEEAHSSRIRGLAAVPEHSQDATSHLLGSVSSDGAVKLWDLRSTGRHPTPCFAHFQQRCVPSSQASMYPQAARASITMLIWRIRLTSGIFLLAANIMIEEISYLGSAFCRGSWHKA